MRNRPVIVHSVTLAVRLVLAFREQHIPVIGLQYSKPKLRNGFHGYAILTLGGPRINDPAVRETLSRFVEPRFMQSPL